MNVDNDIEACTCFTPPVSCSLSGWAYVEYVFYLHFLWWVAYFFIMIIAKQSEEWSCRILTMLHGCIVFLAASLDFWKTPGWACEFGEVPLSEDQRTYLSFMLSYFLFDFLWIHLYGNETWVVYVHHVSSILIIAQIIHWDFGGPGISCGAAGLEFTNPYLQLRWFLRSHGFLNTPIHTAVELWFFFSFLLIRSLGGTILLYKVAKCDKTGMLMKLSLFSVYAVSVVLTWQIVDYFRKKYIVRRNGSIFQRPTISMPPFFRRRTLDQNRRFPDKDTEVEQPAPQPTSSQTSHHHRHELPSEAPVATSSSPPSTAHPSPPPTIPPTPPLVHTSPGASPHPSQIIRRQSAAQPSPQALPATTESPAPTTETPAPTTTETPAPATIEIPASMTTETSGPIETTLSGTQQTSTKSKKQKKGAQSTQPTTKVESEAENEAGAETKENADEEKK